MNEITVERIVGRGVSSAEVRAWVVRYIVERVRPKTILDLGSGVGIYGAMIHAANPKIGMIALDGFLPYLLQEASRASYGGLLWLPIEMIVDGTVSVCTDLTICMDVIEHFDKPTARRVLALPGRMIVSTPLFDYRQGPVGGNSLEEHRCHFTEGELNALGFGMLVKFDHVALDHQHGEIGAFEKGVERCGRS